MTPGDDRPATIEDVAAAAGVSVATVSRALRGLPNVAPSTREKVRLVAEQLRYRADPSASRLAAGRTRTVAMAVPVLDSWYFSQVMAGAEAVLAAEGYDLLLFTVNTDEARRRAFSGPLLKRADALVLVDLRLTDEESRRLVRSGPVASIGFEIEGASTVMVDDVGVGRQATEHLLGLGHTSIGLMHGLTDDPLRFAVPERRREGYRAALAGAGIAHRPEHEVSGDFSVVGGREAMAAMLDLDDPPTAVFAMSDEMAFGALGALWERGLSCPGDVSIIGVDDHDVAEVLGLTTIQQEVAQHGAIAARAVLDQLDDGAGARRHLAATAMVERRTTARLPPR